ncbi:hypothetical protein BHE74_00021623 [Ensete ventricosum]|nr:hypothetical protein BHE74_00021623 [Ensete ventricosum]
MDATFDPDLIHAIFKMVWSRRAERSEEIDVVDIEVCLYVFLCSSLPISLTYLLSLAPPRFINNFHVSCQVGAGTAKKSRPTTGTVNPLVYTRDDCFEKIFAF